MKYYKWNEVGFVFRRSAAVDSGWSFRSSEYRRESVTLFVQRAERTCDWSVAHCCLGSAIRWRKWWTKNDEHKLHSLIHHAFRSLLFIPSLVEISKCAGRKRNCWHTRFIIPWKIIWLSTNYVYWFCFIFVWMKLRVSFPFGWKMQLTMRDETLNRHEVRGKSSIL